MTDTLKKVRFIRPWSIYRVGDEITPNGTLRDWLLQHKYVELSGETSPVRRQGVNRMAEPSQRRGSSRGR